MSTPQNPFETPGQPTYGSPTYGTPAGPPPGWGPPPQPGQLPQQGQWQGGQQTEVKAMIALGLAIAAYTPTIPFIGAIAAIVLARMARRDILASGGRLTGLSLCTWATVLSWIHLALIALVFLFVVLVFLLPFSLA